MGNERARQPAVVLGSRIQRGSQEQAVPRHGKNECLIIWKPILFINLRKEYSWGWKGQIIRVLLSQALDFHWADYCESDPNWGKVYLNDFTDLPNQKFEQYGSEIICKGSNEEHIPDLRLDVFQNGTDDGAKVGVYLKNDSPNQMWTLHDIK